MKLLLSTGLTLACLSLSACNSKSDVPPPAPKVDAPAAANATITPHPAETPAASAATGPAQGGTAIGGMVGGQGQGGANTGSAAAPTAGDGAAAKPPAK